MEVRGFVRRCLGGLIVPLLFSIPLMAFENQYLPQTLLAGDIGKSSSASARVTLIIPPRPATEKNTTRSKTESHQTDRVKQQPDNN